MLDPISWAIIGFVVGAFAGAFWDEITEWASQVLQLILGAIDLAVTVTSEAVVYLVKRGARVYKTMEVISRNIYSGLTKLNEKSEEISRYDIPDDVNQELDRKMKMKLLTRPT
jgi:hypothetical protein